MSSSKRRVLWVTFDFPPRQSSAVYRPIKIYKYMDKESLDVHFLTQSLSFQFKRGVFDETLLDEVAPRPRVYKVPNWVLHDLFYQLAPRRRRKKRVQAGPSSSGASPALSPQPSRSPSGLFKRIYRAVVMTAYVPDQFFLWGWLSALAALLLHLKNRYHAVYTTSYPESAHLAGLALKAVGVKWVVDYRYGGPLWIRKILSHPKSQLRERFDLWYQRLVLSSADVVVTQSESIREDFCRAFSLDHSRVRCIPSGYDETDFASLNGDPAPFGKRDDEIHLLHAGAAYLDGSDQRRMIEELNALDQGLREQGRRIVFHALGDDLFGEEASRGALSFRYQFHGVVPHPQLPAFLRAADWFLLSTITSAAESDDIRGYLPSKMWEYLRAGKPIVLFGPKDEVWNIIEEAGAGVYLGELDRRSAIPVRRLLDEVERVEPGWAKVRQHSWESRARSMESVFSRVMESSAGCKVRERG